LNRLRGAVAMLARVLELPLERGLRDDGAAPATPAAPGVGAAIVRRDAIVVLGAPLRGDRLSPVLAERVAAAVALWRAGGGRWVVASGGVTHGAPRAEGDAIAEALVAGGVPRDAVVVERASRTTAENAARTAELLAPLAATSVWIVTQPFHARRAVWLAQRAGLDARAWWIRDSLQYRDRARAVRWLVREYAAWARLAVAETQRSRRSTRAARPAPIA
jgi:uncharacterized SAM-binding protein YcdF (DUF218 family)